VSSIAVHLELDGDTDPISGRLRHGAGEDPIVFTGWVEFVQAIEIIRAASRDVQAMPDHCSRTRTSPLRPPDTATD
jgi:hypothetical protein